MSLTLKSGFSFDYDNLVGEGKVTKADVAELSDKIQAAVEAIKVMRKDGIIRGHLSKDGTPEKVLSQVILIWVTRLSLMFSAVSSGTP